MKHHLKRIPIIIGVALRIALTAMVSPVAAAGGDTLSGQAQVIDGDSLYVAARELRLAGIDAPEWKQTCRRDGKDWMAGEDAKRAVASLLAGRVIVCEDTGERSYRRVVARCWLDGRELNETIVRMGWAFDNPKYSGGRYAAAETEARTDARGIHAGICSKPWDWRRENR